MYGPLNFDAICLSLTAAVLLGIYLCKKDLKFVALSLLASGLLIGYLSYYATQVSTMLADLHQSAFSLMLQTIFPVIAFCLAAVVLVRWGMQREPRKHKITKKTPLSEGGKLRDKISWSVMRIAAKAELAVYIMAGVVLLIHLLYISRPEALMGDESYYVNEAKRILAGNPMLTLEHPPLGKWIIALGGLIFGKTAFGMRIFPVLFGVASILLFYYICRTLVKRSPSAFTAPDVPASKWEAWFSPVIFIPLMATFLFATDNLSFTQGHLATLDVFCLTLMLAGFLLYLRRNYLYCGIVLGLAALCKETAVFGVIAIVLHWVFSRRQQITEEFRDMWKTLRQRTPASGESDILPMARMLAAAALTFIVLTPLLEYVKTSLWGNPVDRILYLLVGVSKGTAYGPAAWTSTSPWVWLVKPDLQFYNAATELPRYFVTLGWTIWPLIIPSLSYVAYRVARTWKNCADIFSFTFTWFLGVWGSLALIELYSHRPMYTYYIYPLVPAVCLAIALLAWRLWRTAQKTPTTKKLFAISLLVYLTGTLVSFVLMSPLGSFLLK